MARLGPLSVGIFLVASMTLMVEVLLIRIFDVILEAHMGYIVITCAMFAVGLAGAISAIRPLRIGEDPGAKAAVFTVALAVVLVLLRPALNLAPTLYQAIDFRPLRYVIGIGMIYTAVLLPFLLSGLVFSYVFSAGANKIGRLYFFDLAGAALGCILWVPFIRGMGPGGLMLWAAAVLLVAAALFAGRWKYWAFTIPAALVLASLPPILGVDSLDFIEHRDKRGVLDARREGRIEFTEWDPVSKIYVINERSSGASEDGELPPPKHVAYDGGSQSSNFFPFDGDWTALRETIDAGQEPSTRHFWRRGLLASHYLKRDTGAKVLVCGSAAGQETKAALLYGASHVDGIELVETVVRLGKGPYADFIGNIFNDPRVNNRKGEARSFLRATDTKYDIIQIFSNHTSSHIASGSGASVPIYLQTADAYEEYFTHLEDDGVLHVNHHFYPRMVTTASLAWKRLGREDFQKHVLVYQLESWDTLPTMLIKMSPWTQEEVEEIDAFMARRPADEPMPRIVVNPLRPDSSFLSSDFFAGGLPENVSRALDYRAQPSTDDWPFFGNIQKHLSQVEANPERFLNVSMAGAINGRLQMPGGEYVLFLGSGAIGLLYAGLLVLLPLLLSESGRARWEAKYVSLAYFACLGLAFIVIELVLIQKLMRLIGFPVYAYAMVILSMLLSAALGSLSVHRLGVDRERWRLPFIAIFVLGTILVFSSEYLIDPLLGQPLLTRMLAAAAMIFPLGFFMGMPLPIGILTIRHAPPGAVAWAWGMNGVFTVIGGILSGFVALLVGFRITMLIAIGVYVLAMLVLWVLRNRSNVVVSDMPRPRSSALGSRAPNAPQQNRPIETG